MITFKNVVKQYGDAIALDSISFVVDPGEFVVITGKSGAGKTTLGKLLIRETIPTSGDVSVGEFDLSTMKSREVPILRRQIGVVFQDFRLLPDRTAAENIALSLEILGKPAAAIQRTVEELLQVINLDTKADRFPSELSGGEIQRVVIARALATEPAVIFADEPTGNLDQDTGWKIIELLKKINESGTAVILATHNHDFIERLQQRVIELEQGRLIKDSKKTDSDSPQSENFQEVTVAEKKDKTEAETQSASSKKTKTKEKTATTPVKKEEQAKEESVVDVVTNLEEAELEE